MGAPGQIAAGLALVGGLFGLLFLLRPIARHLGLAPEVARKIIHVATGLGALALPWVVRIDWAFYALLGLALTVLLALRSPRLRPAANALHGVERRSYGEIFLVLSVGLLHLFAGGNAVLYVLPLAILTLGDAAAALAGSAYGRRVFRVEDGTKSLEGSTIFFLVSVIVAMACLLLLTETARGNVILLGVMTALFATLVEADSWRGFDNLFLPLGLMLFLSTTLDAGALELAGRMGVLVGSLAGLALLAPRIDLGRHAMRVHVIAVFLILSATTAWNAVLPVAALAVHAFARRLAPARDRHPDLDMVAAVALLSFGALAAGKGLGVNVINFYGLAAGSLAAALVALALTPFGPATRALAGFAASAALYLGWIGITAMNGAWAGWHGEIRPGALAIFLVATVLPAVRPALFAENRAPKLLAISAAPALVLCAVTLAFGAAT